MNKREVRALVMDIGYLVNKHNDNISAIMDELNEKDSYKPFQKVLKDAKEYNKLKEKND